MSNELEKRPEHTPRRAERMEKGAMNPVLRFLGMLRHNLGWKILALFLAVALWAGLITQDPTLTRERTFSGVSVNIVGVETLKKNGFIVLSNLTGNPPTVRLRVDVTQKEYGNVTASNYNVRLDLSRINSVGTQQIKITGTSTSTYGTVEEISPDTLEVEVDAYKTIYRIPVTVVREGDPPEGYYSTPATLDPPQIAISGPASLVEKVSRAVATIDQSTLPAREELVRTGIPFVLVDSYGNEVDSHLIEVTSESVLLDNVVVEQMLYPTVTIDLSQAALTTGQPAAGYRVKHVTVTPSQIVAAGREDSLQQVEKLFLESPVDITGAKESFTSVIKIRKPAEIEDLSMSSVTVTVEIEPITLDRSFDGLKVQVLGLGDGLSAVLDKPKASATITGPKLWLDALKTGDVTLTADLTGLTAGTYSVPLLCTAAGGQNVGYTYATDPAMVQVTLTGK